MPRKKIENDQSKIDNLCEALKNTESSDKIWKLRSQKSCPLIEDIDGDPENKQVTFFYHDESKKCKNVEIRSQAGYLPTLIERFGKGILPDPKTQKPPKLPMKQVPNSDVWTLTVKLPNTFCAPYYFEVQTENGVKDDTDPLNPQRSYQSANDKHPTPFLDLSPPDVKSQKTMNMNDIKKAGRLERWSVSDEGVLTKRSDVYTPEKNERMFTVHFPNPKQHNPKTTYPMRLFLDGKWYLEEAEVPAMLDDEPTINIMLEPKAIESNVDVDREQEYRPENNGKDFAKFLAKIFVPKVQEKFNNISKEARDITICGGSLGGFAATYTGLKYPEVFGNVLAQSAALWLFWPEKEQERLPQECLAQMLLEEKLDLKQLQKSCFHLESSQLDHPSIRSSNSHFDSFMNKKIPWSLTNTGYSAHHFVSWEKFLPNANCALQEMRICDNKKLEQKEHLGDETKIPINAPEF